MSARAASSIVLVGALLLGIPWGAGAAAPFAAPNGDAYGDFPVASEVRLGGDETATRMVVDFSQKIDMRAFTLANPYRVIIDLPQVVFRFPPKTGEGGRGLIKAFRYGLMMTGGSRIVIDLTRPARVEKSFVLDATNDQPARFVLDLAAVDRDAFMRTIALENRVREPPAVVKPQPKSDARPIIVLDPGHGGIDNGTKAASGEMEKTIVLEFALLLRDKIEKAGKYHVVMTRSDDTFVALADRVQFARAQQASLFISIHADALPRGEGDAQGATVYTLSETASDSEAARLAETENRADVIAGVDLTYQPDDVADILIDLAQRETKSYSVQFARGLIDSMRTAARMHKNSLKSAGFRVLKAPDIPSVLIELGYVSNRQDIKSLTSADWREHTADSIAKAIDRFFITRLAGSGRGNGQN
ncbi:MAG: N-acetylmuramoyl-L-alanine amidase [Sphingomonadales bacterium]|nr:N-acetylmuramoyl-L-alanine amidase [Sphingomonadales bacterium]